MMSTSADSQRCCAESIVRGVWRTVTDEGDMVPDADARKESNGSTLEASLSHDTTDEPSSRVTKGRDGGRLERSSVRAVWYFVKSGIADGSKVWLSETETLTFSSDTERTLRSFSNRAILPVVMLVAPEIGLSLLSPWLTPPFGFHCFSLPEPLTPPRRRTAGGGPRAVARLDREAVRLLKLA